MQSEVYYKRLLLEELLEKSKKIQLLNLFLWVLKLICYES